MTSKNRGAWVALVGVYGFLIGLVGLAGCSDEGARAQVKQLEQRLATHERSMKSLDGRLASIEQALGALTDRMADDASHQVQQGTELQSQLTEIERRLGQVEHTLESAHSAAPMGGAAEGGAAAAPEAMPSGARSLAQ